jgi:hypothetical protein
VEELARAIRKAAEAQQWEVVQVLAQQLREMRQGMPTSGVVSLVEERRKRR